MEFTKYNFIKQKYEGILEIYPQKATNTMVLNKVLLELQKEYDLVQIFTGYIRAFKNRI
jgi:hypothetical protein